MSAFERNISEVCLLRKSLYGLKQSPGTWFDKFIKVAKRCGYLHAQTDHILFLKHYDSGKFIVFIMYVNDIIMTQDDPEEIDTLKWCVCREFELKNPEIVRYLLEMEVARSDVGDSISQKNYILDPLRDIRMLGYRPTNSLMEPKKKLTVEDDSNSVDKERYQCLDAFQ